MTLILINTIIAAIIPFVPFIYIPILAIILAITTYMLLNKQSKAPLIIALTLLLTISMKSHTEKVATDNINNYFLQPLINATMEITEIRDDYYLLTILEAQGQKVKSGHSMLLYSNQQYQKGDILKYQGEVRQFYQYKNPGTYYPNNRYVYKTHGYISESTGILQVIQSQTQSHNILDSIKEKAIKRLQTLDTKGAILSPGILLGEKSQIDNQYLESFRNSGLIHITAVSGLHIGIVFMIFTQVSTLIINNKRYSYIIGFLMALLFSIFVGFKPSTLRAITMLLIYMISKAMGYPYSLSRSVQLTALIFITLNPLVVLDMGFQFSYIAVLGIAYITPRLKILDRINNLYIQNILKITLGVQLALLPINYHYYRGLPLFSIISNLLVAPILPFYLGLIMGYAIFPIWLLKLPIEILSSYILTWSELTGTWLHLSIGKILVISMLILAVLSYYLLRNKILSRNNLVALMLVAALSICTIIYIQPAVEIYFLDVGQGDSIVIRYKGTNILIDTGGSMGSNIGERVVVPTLKFLGIKRLDYVFLTHPHYDHIGALPEITEAIPVKNLLVPDNENMYTNSYLNIISQIEGQVGNIVPVKKGDSLSIDKLKIDILHPTPSYNPTDSNSNNISLVKLLQYADTRVLFTGDIESSEKDILHLLTDVEILKTAHHGSSTSSSVEFLSKTLPKHAIISVGNNNYGHPSQEVLTRLSNVNSTSHITKDTGMVSVKINGRGYKVKNYLR